MAASHDGLSVVLSSHVLAELERVADYLIVLSRGHLQVAGEVEKLLAGHRVVSGPCDQAGEIADRLRIVHIAKHEDRARLLVTSSGQDDPLPDGRPASAAEINTLSTQLRQAGGLPTPQAVQQWFAEQGYLKYFTYQPETRFWHFQLIEGGWLLILSLLLGAATIWLIRHRAT